MGSTRRAAHDRPGRIHRRHAQGRRIEHRIYIGEERDLPFRIQIPLAAAPKLVQDVLDAVSKLKAEGVSVLIVEQNARSVLAVTDRVFILDHGQIVHQGPSRALLDDEDQRRTLIGA